jgi:hypothetical protein
MYHFTNTLLSQKLNIKLNIQDKRGIPFPSKAAKYVTLNFEFSIIAHVELLFWLHLILKIACVYKTECMDCLNNCRDIFFIYTANL